MGALWLGKWDKHPPAFTSLRRMLSKKPSWDERSKPSALLAERGRQADRTRSLWGSSVSLLSKQAHPLPPCPITVWPLRRKSHCIQKGTSYTISRITLAVGIPVPRCAKRLADTWESKHCCQTAKNAWQGDTTATAQVWKCLLCDEIALEEQHVDVFFLIAPHHKRVRRANRESLVCVFTSCEWALETERRTWSECLCDTTTILKPSYII